jgi:hypothetical protein
MTWAPLDGCQCNECGGRRRMASMTKKNAEARPAKAPRVEKRKVTMKSAVILADGTHGEIMAQDFVPLEYLDEYIADAQTRWQSVTVDRDKHDPGPGGDDGPTTKPKLK